jgi:hypothetical protein
MVSPTRDRLFGLRTTILKLLVTMAEIASDMAAQLARVREMEKNGDLAAIPRDYMNLH